MRRNKLLGLILFIFCVFLSQENIFSQITIGSDSEPVKGALLHVKQNDNLGVNANKGLGMPRVGLTELTDLRDISGTPEPTEHVGLIVYNVNTSFCSQPEPINPGLYVWDGTLWVALVTGDTTPVAGVGSVTDIDGNVYPTMRYATTVSGTTYDAGEWMTQNLRVTQFDTNITDLPSPPSLTATYAQTPNPAYYYPKPSGAYDGSAADRAFSDQHPTFGLFYNWYAAVASQNGANYSQGQGTAEEDLYYQGVCPNGWHVPNDKEWNMLEKVIALSSEKYSTYPVGSTIWDSSWETDLDWRPASGEGQGRAMQMPCKLPDSNYDNPNGKSLSVYKGGFNMLFVGYISNTGHSEGYGYTSIFWSSSSYNSVNAWYRQILMGEYGVDRKYIGKEFVGPIRCKKD